jgi:predicted nucleotidyltransferase
MDTLTNREAIREIEKLKGRLSDRYKIEKAILFGSRAREDHLLDSDVDLLLVSKDFTPNFHHRIRDVAVEWDHTVPLEPICYTPEEFEIKKKQMGIVRQAVKEGVPV